MTRRSISSRKSALRMFDDETKVERELFLSMLRSEYWAQMENGRLPENSMAAKRLLRSIDEAKDCRHICLMDWDVCVNKMSPEPGMVRFLCSFLPDWLEFVVLTL